MYFDRNLKTIIKISGKWRPKNRTENPSGYPPKQTTGSKRVFQAETEFKLLYPHAVVHVEVVSPDVVPGELGLGFDEPGFAVTRLGEFAADFSPRDISPVVVFSPGFLSVEHVNADFRYRPYKAVVNYLENSVHCVSANKSGRETESGFSIAIHLRRTLLVSVNAHNGILFCI